MNGIEHGMFATVQYIGNVALFIPYGALFPWKKKSWVPVIVAFLCSVGIESTQYMLRLGLCEIDDVVANTFGALVGVGIYKLLQRYAGELRGEHRHA